jgi:hypothetical protein
VVRPVHDLSDEILNAKEDENDIITLKLVTFPSKPIRDLLTPLSSN